ncbi:MAG: recombination regulator RecX [Gemmatimonadota bacterium]|nr:recombination regulator RecX [Gemmatimonadota bacterium]
MARITGLAPDPRRPDVVRVLVDGRPFCTVPATAAAAAHLEVGAVWSGELSASASRFADVAAVWQSLLATLARRAFSVEELRRRLTRKGHHPEVVAEAILRAQRERLLDDALFAEQYVVSRAARGRGPARLRRDLQALGVATRHIEAALAKQWPEGAEPLDLARQLASRRARQLAGVPLDVRRRRVLAYLGRRGFTGAAAVRITREACANP